MRIKNYECIYLQWDTDYFGISSARVNLSGVVDEKSQDEIIKFCEDYDFVTISNINNLIENSYWIGNRTSAFLADMNIQFLKVLVNKPDHQDHQTYVARNYPRNERIVAIARESFHYSRFFNDPSLPQEQVKKIYVHWTECAFEQEIKYFVICERAGDVAGYILFSIKDDISVIELIAVDKKYQRQRVGKSLIETMELFVLEQGINKIKVGTQLNNILAFQFYSKLGFDYVGCAGMYHMWRR